MWLCFAVRMTARLGRADAFVQKAVVEAQEPLGDAIDPGDPIRALVAADGLGSMGRRHDEEDIRRRGSAGPAARPQGQDSAASRRSDEIASFHVLPTRLITWGFPGQPSLPSG